MTKFPFNKDHGLYLPKEKPKPVKIERPIEWDCPKCGEHYDTRKQENEEATVGSIGPDHIPHINCPSCKKCMGCLGD